MFGIRLQVEVHGIDRVGDVRHNRCETANRTIMLSESYIGEYAPIPMQAQRFAGSVSGGAKVTCSHCENNSANDLMARAQYRCDQTDRLFGANFGEWTTH